MISLILAAIFISIGGLYSISVVGVTGAANHGEHPLVVSLIHLAVFYFGGKEWPSLSSTLYYGGLVASMGVSFWAQFAAHGGSDAVKWIIRILLGLLYIGFLFVLFARPGA